jgi:hypothetical protein
MQTLESSEKIAPAMICDARRRDVLADEAKNNLKNNLKNNVTTGPLV